MLKEIYISGAVRTPIGRFGGGLSSLTAVQLGTVAVKAAMERAGIAQEQVDQAVFGHGRQAGCGTNPARQVACAAGIPFEKPAWTVNQACLSGMQAVFAAARAILLDEADVVLAGGMESMSKVPYMFDARWGVRMGHQQMDDGMYRDGFLDPITGQIMGETAETLADRYSISREDQDRYAMDTQARCQEAMAAGRFRDEIVPVEVSGRREVTVVETDEHPRAGVTVEGLGRLKAVFRSDGTVTAGNSSGITDGAAAMMVLSGEAVRRLGVQPQVRLTSWAVEGVDPGIMGIGPVPAVRTLFRRNELELADMDLVELNEAFAAQVLAVDRELRFDRSRMNVNGGAIALGHPIGCSGARIMVTLIHEMCRRKAINGLATLCVSGGLGGAAHLLLADN
jgi:acetyl-CoA C-acetyltransferase